MEELKYKEGEGIFGNLELYKQERIKNYKRRGMDTNDSGDFMLTKKNFNIITKELITGKVNDITAKRKTFKNGRTR